MQLNRRMHNRQSPQPQTTLNHGSAESEHLVLSWVSIHRVTPLCPSQKKISSYYTFCHGCAIFGGKNTELTHTQRMHQGYSEVVFFGAEIYNWKINIDKRVEGCGKIQVLVIDLGYSHHLRHPKINWSLTYKHLTKNTMCLYVSSQTLCHLTQWSPTTGFWILS